MELFGGCISQCITIIFIIFFSVAANADCSLKETRSESGGYRILEVGKHKLEDVESFKILGDSLFYAISPVYGKPELGVINCTSLERKTLVKAKTSKQYPGGQDYFRLKSVEQRKGHFLIEYYYAPNIDSVDFKRFESPKNLKTFRY